MDSTPAPLAVPAPAPILAATTERGRPQETLRHLFTGLRMHGLTWALEVVVVELSFFAAFWIRYGGRIPHPYQGATAVAVVLLIAGCYTLFDLAFHTYRIVWRHATLIDMAALALTVLATVVTIGLLELFPLAADRPIPLSVLAIGGAGAYLSLAHLDLLPRTRAAISQSRSGTPLLIYGAGAAGIAVARELTSYSREYRPVGFLDDDLRKIGREIAGLPVVGMGAALGRALQRFSVETVAIAMPSATPERIREISRMTLDAGARPLVVPTIRELLHGSKLSLRSVSIEELIGRSEVAVDFEELRSTFHNRRVLVTGAAGSIGSELTRQIAALRPSRLNLLDINESGLAELRDEIARSHPEPEITVVSITDPSALRAAFLRFRPDIVLHAAALKHVDIVEGQPRGAVEVNVRGTWLCARAAQEVGVHRFVLISTDKAVDPTGVLGASKRIGELMMASLSRSSTIFSAVRFGNVLGSRGSVLPKFERQIAAGGPLTVTHPDVRRFFMSIAEAVRLVLQCAAFAEPGGMYVLDMGDEVRITDFAIRLAQLHGLRVPRDLDISYTGLRPGERLREKLVGEREHPHATRHPKIWEVTEAAMDAPDRDWEAVLSDLCGLDDGEAETLRARLLAHCDGLIGARR